MTGQKLRKIFLVKYIFFKKKKLNKIRKQEKMANMQVANLIRNMTVTNVLY